MSEHDIIPLTDIKGKSSGVTTHRLIRGQGS